MPMIDKDEAISVIQTYLEFVGSRDINCAISAINSIATHDCAVVTDSRWIRLESCRNRSDYFECENCRSRVRMPTYSFDCDYDYCPFCAARMSLPTIDESEVSQDEVHPDGVQ